MKKQGILEGTVRTACNLVGAIPVGIVHGISRRGGAVDSYISKNKDRIREVVGAGIIAGGIGYSVVD